MFASADFIRFASEQLVANARIVLRKAGIEASPEMIERVICTAPRRDTDLTAVELVERSFCMRCILRHDMPPGSFDPQLEAAAAFFIDYLPTLSAESRRWLQESAIGFLRGMTGNIGVIGHQARDRKKSAAPAFGKPAQMVVRKVG